MILSFAAAPPPAMQAAEPGAARASAVQVRAAGGGQLSRMGSGVVVGPGLIVTNAHVVGSQSQTEVFASGRWITARIRALRLEQDLALLEAPGVPAPSAPLTARPPHEGETLWNWGFPRGGALVSAQATVAMLWSFRGERLLQVQMAAAPGLSGSGLFNAQGELTGILTFGMNLPPGTVIALPAAWVRALIESGPGVAFSEGPPLGLNKDFVLNRLAEPDNREGWIRLTTQWTRDEPRNPEAWAALAQAELWQVDADQDGPSVLARAARIVRAAQTAAALDPGRFENWLALGQSHDLLGQFDKAVEALQRAIQLGPDRASAWESLGRAQFSRGHYPDAIHALQEAVRLAPDAAMAWSLLAQAELQVGRPGLAQEHFGAAVRWRPLRPALLLEWGRVALRNKDLRTAQEALARLQALGATEAAELKRALDAR